MNISRNSLALVTFALTIFTSASLLFVVQPMIGKIILPYMGGSSSVWTTVMLFFQSMLVVGYIYAHAIAQKIPLRAQIGLHFALIGAALLTSLPFDIPTAWIQSESAPALWLLAALVVSIGLPLLVVSSSAPLFQHWFGYTDHPDTDDPYYLYAASNVGSMLALFGYPFFVERTFGVETQTSLWAWGFGLLGVMAFGCAALIFDWNSVPDKPEAPEAEASLTWKRRGWWLLITFIPSSLMLGVTTYLTTDIASVPFLWVIPLGIYLLSFILVFARLPIRLWIYRLAIPFVTLLVLSGTFTEFFGIGLVVFAHLWLFFLFAIYFHGQLAEDRPHPAHLTEYYIWMSVGGALGGLFNALIAPAVFDWMIEYYLVMALGIAAIVPYRAAEEFAATTLKKWGAGLALVVFVGIYFWSVGLLGLEEFGRTFGILFVVGALVAMALKFPMVQNIALALVLLVGFSFFEAMPTAITYERSFFAAYTVYKDRIAEKRMRVFSHGTTQHGMQARSEKLQHMPLGYHHPAGPVGDIYSQIPHERVAVAGLGVGAMAAYAEEGKEFVFFEIDPLVEKMAREHFTYLDRCGKRCEVQIGDARKKLREAKPHSFDIIMMDAYNSDSVPTHLLTTEALELYLSRLSEDGVVIFHVSNRYLNIEKVVGRIAEDQGVVARTKSYTPALQESDELAYSSTYVVVARETDDLRRLAESPRWKKTEVADVLWTDNFTNIVSVFDM